MFSDRIEKIFLLTISNGHYSLDYLRTYINDQLCSSPEFKSNSSIPDTFINIDNNSTCEFTGVITF